MSLAPPQVVLLDRDGVINRESPEYIKSVAEWQPLPGSLEAIARLHRAGFVIGIATNQSAVGRGMISVDTLWDIHRHMLQEILDHGGFVQRIFFCLHGPDEGCNCRKPKPGLLYQAAEYFACGFDHMTLIGDSQRDLDAAAAVGARAWLVRTGNGRHTEAAWGSQPQGPVYDDLAAAADALIAEQSA